MMSPERRRADDHSHRTEHGREVDRAAAGWSDRFDGAGGKLRPGLEGAHRYRRSPLHAGRSERQPGARAVHTSWWKCPRRAQFSTPPHHVAWFCSTRSAAAHRPMMGSRSPGRSANTYTTRSSARRSSRPTTIELTQLADTLVAVRNYNVQVREIGDQVLFLHRLQPGGADRSYGIEVGRLAGLPPAVLDRAKELLRLLEAEQIVPRSRQCVVTALRPRMVISWLCSVS